MNSPHLFPQAATGADTGGLRGQEAGGAGGLGVQATRRQEGPGGRRGQKAGGAGKQEGQATRRQEGQGAKRAGGPRSGGAGGLGGQTTRKQEGQAVRRGWDGLHEGQGQRHAQHHAPAAAPLLSGGPVAGMPGEWEGPPPPNTPAPDGCCCGWCSVCCRGCEGWSWGGLGWAGAGVGCGGLPCAARPTSAARRPRVASMPRSSKASAPTCGARG